MKKLLAKGVFIWDGGERRSDRYGSIHLCSEPYDGRPAAVVEYNTRLLKQLDGKRVHLTCVVIETRKSGHVGDLSHGFYPSIPDVGEIVDLGVGILGHADGFDGKPDIVLQPGDGRKTFWIDPRKLYRLHDQTVEVYVEITRAKFSPAPVFEPAASGVTFVTPDKAGANVQVKGVSDVRSIRIPPRITPLGDGMFTMFSDYKPGDRVPFEKKS